VSDEGVRREWPLVLRAAILLEAWQDIEVLQHTTWLGPLFVAALLRQEGVAANHLACLHLGAKNIPRERRRARNRSDRLLACLDAALGGLKEHDRLVLAKNSWSGGRAGAMPDRGFQTWSSWCSRGRSSRPA